MGAECCTRKLWLTLLSEYFGEKKKKGERNELSALIHFSCNSAAFSLKSAKSSRSMTSFPRVLLGLLEGGTAAVPMAAPFYREKNQDPEPRQFA